jgi:hypothetical protein
VRVETAGARCNERESGRLLGFSPGFDQAFGRSGELGVTDRSPVAAEIDGVKDGEGTADAEGKAEEETERRAVKDTHGFDDVTRGAWRRDYLPICSGVRKPMSAGVRTMATKMRAVRKSGIMQDVSARIEGGMSSRTPTATASLLG